MRLTGKTAIITGGGRGIGRAICLRLSQEGAAIVVAECDQPEAKQVVAEIEKSAAAGDGRVPPPEPAAAAQAQPSDGAA